MEQNSNILSAELALQEYWRTRLANIEVFREIAGYEHGSTRFKDVESVRALVISHLSLADRIARRTFGLSGDDAGFWRKQITEMVYPYMRYLRDIPLDHDHVWNEELVEMLLKMKDSSEKLDALIEEDSAESQNA
ncbi:MAG: hypothetical protein AAFW97_15300 [Pseudomonadota bacterium]